MSVPHGSAKLAKNSLGVGGTTDAWRDGGSKKSRSNDDISRGSVEAGLGNWKGWSKSNHVRFVGFGSGSDTACERSHSIPRGRFGRGQYESPSDNRLFL